jgi:hypothetical protein
MSSRWCSRRIVGGLAFFAAMLTGSARAEPPFTPEPTAVDEAAVPERPTWRFRKTDRPIKVVVLAGSIGAFPRGPYASHLERMCSAVEVRNLSKTGLGAWALRKRFVEQVLDNPHVRPKASEGQEHWLVFGGGLNSVGAPRRTNEHIRRLFLLVHQNGFRVVGLTLTPWGDDADRRFRGLAGLEYREATRIVSDFILGRLTPREALGSHASSRGGSGASWTDEERPDVAVDLYDSPLRDREAELRDLEAMRQALRDDRKWQEENKAFDAATRLLRFESKAYLAAELPRWYLRPELRSFDHIHPNAEGHRLIAEIMCPSLPASWSCTCDGDDDAETADTATRSP